MGMNRGKMVEGYWMIAQEDNDDDANDVRMIDTDSEVEFAHGDNPAKRRRRLYDDDNYDAIDNLDANEDK